MNILYLISYAGKAEPAAFDALCAGGTVPKTFSQMELTFQADGKLVETVPFTYGEGLDSLPDIPAKKGYSAAWPDMDYSHIQGLRLEAREKLAALRPENLGQAGRISGVSPADIAALMVYLHTRETPPEGGTST